MSSPEGDPSAKRYYSVNDDDVVCGRGNGVAALTGNLKYRELIQNNKPRYTSAHRSDKLNIAKEVVDMVHNAGGKFVKEVDAGVYVEITGPQALEKTCQALREGPKMRQKIQREEAKAERLATKSDQSALGVKVKIAAPPVRGGKTLRRPPSNSNGTSITAGTKKKHRLPTIINTKASKSKSSGGAEKHSEISTRYVRTPLALPPKRSAASASSSSIQRPSNKFYSAAAQAAGQFDDPPELDDSADSYSDGSASAGPKYPAAAPKYPAATPKSPAAPATTAKATTTTTISIVQQPLLTATGTKVQQLQQQPQPQQQKQKQQQQPPPQQQQKQQEQPQQQKQQQTHQQQQRRPMTQRQLPTINKPVQKTSGEAENAKAKQPQLLQHHSNNYLHSYPQDHYHEQYHDYHHGYQYPPYPPQPPPTKAPEAEGWFCDFINNNNDEWHDMYRLLVIFEHKFGHCGIPPSSGEEDGSKEEWETSGLSDWASVQRHVYRDIRKGLRIPNAVELDRLKSLERLGFVWDYEEWHWERNYRDLLEFQQREEHARNKNTNYVDRAAVQVNEDDEPSDVARCAGLALWVKEQRRLFLEGIQGKIHPMRPDRVKKLEKIDFSCVATLQRKLDCYEDKQAPATAAVTAVDAVMGSAAAQ